HGGRPWSAGRARARRRAPGGLRVWTHSIRPRIDRARRESGAPRPVRWARMVRATSAPSPREVHVELRRGDASKLRLPIAPLRFFQILEGRPARAARKYEPHVEKSTLTSASRAG